MTFEEEMKAEIKKLKDSVMSEARQKFQRELAEMKRGFEEKHQETRDGTEEPDLMYLIENCTNGLEIREGDDNIHNLFEVMNDFKKAVLKILKRPTIDLDSNYDILILIRDAYSNIDFVKRQKIEEDPRVQTAKDNLRPVEVKVLKQRKLLEAQVPPTPQNEHKKDEKSTPKTDFSFFKPSTWPSGRKQQTPNQRIHQLLWRMQEINL